MSDLLSDLPRADLQSATKPTMLFLFVFLFLFLFLFLLLLLFLFLFCSSRRFQTNPLEMVFPGNHFLN